MRFVPILFQTEMIEAILSGHKTQTRRELKIQPIDDTEQSGYVFSGNHMSSYKNDMFHEDWKKRYIQDYSKYQIADVLWIRETWRIVHVNHNHSFGDFYTVQFKNHLVFDFSHVSEIQDLLKSKFKKSSESYIGDAYGNWIPSIHMPREVCRLFLEVTDVKMERIQDISEEDAMFEGVARETVSVINRAEDQPLHVLPKTSRELRFQDYKGRYTIEHPMHRPFRSAKQSFESLWRKIYGDQSWDRNKWVFAISFKVVERPADFLSESKLELEKQPHI